MIARLERGKIGLEEFIRNAGSERIQPELLVKIQALGQRAEQHRVDRFCIARLRRHGQCRQRHDIGLFLECLQYIFGIFCCADDDRQRQDLLGVDDQRSAVL